MPRYVYKCRECQDSFVTVHGITEDQDHCEICYESGCVYRIPQMPSVKMVGEKVGHIVTEHIEDARKEIREEKKRLRRQEYDPS